MKLVPLPKGCIRSGAPLPFDVRDAAGRLLLAAGMKPDLVFDGGWRPSGALFADETDCCEWQRHQASANDVDEKTNDLAREVGVARPEAAAVRPVARDATLIGRWAERARALDAALRDIGQGNAWMQRLLAVHDRVMDLFERKPEASLYWLIFHSAHVTELYCSHHALLCALVTRDAARILGWSADMVTDVTLAALTMNVSMRRLQDRLASCLVEITPEMREDIDSHARRSAWALEQAGVANQRLIGIVRHHHDDRFKDLPIDRLEPVQRGARLLRRVDIFTAKISRRRDRDPASPMQAARDSCIGAGGVPDEIGSALLKAMGLYPPGCFVELQSGEVGIVIGRGRQVNRPVAAALVSPTGAPLTLPEVRDAGDPRFAIKKALAATAVDVIPPHELLVALC